MRKEKRQLILMKPSFLIKSKKNFNSILGLNKTILLKNLSVIHLCLKAIRMMKKTRIKSKPLRVLMMEITGKKMKADQVKVHLNKVM